MVYYTSDKSKFIIYYLVFTGWVFLNFNASPFLLLFVTSLIFFQLCFLRRPKEYLKCKIKYFMINSLMWIMYYFRTASLLHTFFNKMIKEKTKSKKSSLGSPSSTSTLYEWKKEDKVVVTSLVLLGSASGT